MMTSLAHSRRFLVRAALIMAFLPVGLSARAADSPDAAKNHTAMSALQAELAKLGKPKLEGEKLFFGSAAVNGDFTIVDALKAKYGCSATLFVKKGDAFVRVSTNVMKEGKRAVGTPLDPSGPAYAAVSKDKVFYGVVDILGKLFDTGYEPIKNAAGEVVGAYYVGYALE